MTSSPLLIWLFSVPALAAVLAYLLGRKRPEAAGITAIAGATVTFGLSIAIANQVRNGLHLTALGNQFYADGLGALVGLLVSFVGLMATVFAYPYLRRQVAQGELAIERLPLYSSWTLCSSAR